MFNDIQPWPNQTEQDANKNYLYAILCQYSAYAAGTDQMQGDRLYYMIGLIEELQELRVADHEEEVYEEAMDVVWYLSRLGLPTHFKGGFKESFNPVDVAISMAQKIKKIHRKKCPRTKYPELDYQGHINTLWSYIFYGIFGGNTLLFTSAMKKSIDKLNRRAHDDSIANTSSSI